MDRVKELQRRLDQAREKKQKELDGEARPRVLASRDIDAHDIDTHDIENHKLMSGLKREEGHAGNPQYEGLVYGSRECLRIGKTQPKHGFLYPALLITVVGPHIRAYGMGVDGLGGQICEPLTPAMDMLLVPQYPDRLEQLARFFRSIPVLLEGLVADYEQAFKFAKQRHEPLRDAVTHEALPYPLRYDETLDRVQRIAGSHVYLRWDKGGAVAAIKFVQRYSTEIHEPWARCGVAPQLVGEPVELAGGWKQVGMEFLAPDIAEGEGWLPLSRLLLLLDGCSAAISSKAVKPLRLELHLSKDELALPRLLERANKLLAEAHAEQPNSGLRFVHGDARPNNIMVLVKERKVADMKVVDLDWAGEDAKATYPVLMNTQQIQWPGGAGPLQLMRQHHDVELLRLQMDPATASGY